MKRLLVLLLFILQACSTTKPVEPSKSPTDVVKVSTNPNDISDTINKLLDSFDIGQGIAWQDHDRNLFELAKERDTTVFIWFYSNGCGYCKEMEADIFAHQEIKDALEELFIPIKYNVSDSEHKYKEYATPLLKSSDITIPVSVFILPDGSSVAINGYVGPPQFATLLGKILMYNAQ